MYLWHKDIAKWKHDKTLYLSVPFTWLMPKAEKIACSYNGKVKIGGPGTMKPSICNNFEPILFHNPAATFTTRGCPHQCVFCAVPKLEGKFREIKNFRPAPVICDNNLLAASYKHLEKVIDKIKTFPLIDFNQGLDARLFTPKIADLLGMLKCKIRFSFDHLSLETIVHDAIKLAQQRTSKDVRVYVLFGFNDSLENARYRLDKVISWGAWPNPSRYQPLDAIKKNAYVAPGWTQEELFKINKYYYNIRRTKKIPYDEFSYRVSDGPRLPYRKRRS